MALHCSMATSLNKGHKVTKNMSKLSIAVNAHQAQQVCVGHNLRGMQLCFIQAQYSGAAQDLQGQTGQIHQEMKEDTHIHAKRKQEELSNALAAKRKAVAQN